VLSIPLTSSGAICDEDPLFTDALKVVQVNGRIRRNSPLRWEGYLGGTLQLLKNNAPIGNGQFFSTLGVGTHRPVACPANTSCNKECENCYDVKQVAGFWEIGTEGVFWGNVTVAVGHFQDCKIRWSFQGHYRAPVVAGAAEPLPPSSGWGLCGTIDGVLDCKCP